MNYGSETVFNDDQRLRNRIANVLEDAWFDKPQEIDGIKVSRQVDSIHLQYQDATTVTQSREQAADTLFEILSAEDELEDEDA